MAAPEAHQEHDDGIDLLGAADLVFIDLDAAEESARSVLSVSTGPSRAAAMARRTLGLAARERQRLAEAVDLLEEGVDIAEEIGDVPLAAAIRSTLALTVGYTGDWDAALALSTRCLADVPASEAGRARTQHALILQRLGHNEEALREYEVGIEGLRREEDGAGLAKALCNAGLAAVEAGRSTQAAGWLDEALGLARDLGLTRLVAMVHGNIGYRCSRIGDLVGALDALQRCEAAWRTSGGVAEMLGLVWLDRAEVLADAGLPAEAADMAQRATDLLGGSDNAAEAVEVLLRAARILLGCGRADLAARHADAALVRLDGQHRPGWAAQAEYLRLAAQPAAVEVSQVARIGASLSALGWSLEARDARLLGARAAIEADQRHLARRMLAEVAEVDRGDAPVAHRLQAHVAAARLARMDRDLAAVAAEGLAAATLLATHQRTLGSMELRARAGLHLEELAAMWIDAAVETGSAAGVLEAADAMAPLHDVAVEVRPEPDTELRDLLAQLRAIDQREATEGPGQDLADRADLERRIVDLDRRRGGIGTTVDQPGWPAWSAAVGADLLQLVVNRGRVLAVAVADGDPRMSELGAVEELDLLAHQARTAAIRGLRRPGTRTDAGTLADRLGQLVDRIAPRSGVPLVIAAGPDVPDLPWGVAPQLAGSGWTATTGLGRWAARGQVPDAAGQMGVVEGPDMPHAAAERRALHRLDPQAVVVRGGRATAERVRRLLADVGVAHVMAHGEMNHANPLLSSMRLADGRLWGYEIARVGSLPQLVVLASCNVGGRRRYRGGAALGLPTVFLRGGARSVVAATLPVHDQAAMVFGRRFHAERISGTPLPAALAAAVRDDELEPAQSFALQVALVLSQ